MIKWSFGFCLGGYGKRRFQFFMEDWDLSEAWSHLVESGITLLRWGLFHQLGLGTIVDAESWFVTCLLWAFANVFFSEFLWIRNTNMDLMRRKLKLISENENYLCRCSIHNVCYWILNSDIGIFFRFFEDIVRFFHSYFKGGVILQMLSELFLGKRSFYEGLNLLSKFHCICSVG